MGLGQGTVDGAILSAGSIDKGVSEHFTEDGDNEDKETDCEVNDNLLR